MAMQYVDTFSDDSKTEAELVRDARSGSEAAFLAIYHRHRSAVFRFVWRLSGSVSTAEDVTQECFLALLHGAEFDRGRGSLRTYLFGIARHLFLRRLRISDRETEELAEAIAPLDLLDDLLTVERSELVARAVAQLPMLQREAIVLFTYEEMSLEQIAAIVKADVGAVKSRLRRARESLYAALAPLLAEGSGRRNL
jgi:RNA polymerase sigma-70 factor (ECF subfamily)